MADVFISYSNKDRALAEGLARNIVAAGWTAWWDPEIRAGENYRDVILRELDAAKAVVVIWTKHSIKSEWVISEAGRAMRKPRDRYIAVRENGLDEHDIPPPFDVRHVVLVDAWAAIATSVKARCGIQASSVASVGDDTSDDQQWREVEKIYARKSSSWWGDLEDELRALLSYLHLHPTGRRYTEALGRAENVLFHLENEKDMSLEREWFEEIKTRK